jgi:hypothetical protein
MEESNLSIWGNVEKGIPDPLFGILQYFLADKNP